MATKTAHTSSLSQRTVTATTQPSPIPPTNHLQQVAEAVTQAAVTQARLEKRSSHILSIWTDSSRSLNSTCSTPTATCLTLQAWAHLILQPQTTQDTSQSRSPLAETHTTNCSSSFTQQSLVCSKARWKVSVKLVLTMQHHPTLATLLTSTRLQKKVTASKAVLSDGAATPSVKETSAKDTSRHSLHNLKERLLNKRSPSLNLL